MKFSFTKSQLSIHTANIIANFICLHVTYTAFKQGERKNVRTMWKPSYLKQPIWSKSILVRTVNISIL